MIIISCVILNEQVVTHADLLPMVTACRLPNENGIDSPHIMGSYRALNRIDCTRVHPSDIPILPADRPGGLRLGGCYDLLTRRSRGQDGQEATTGFSRSNVLFHGRSSETCRLTTNCMTLWQPRATPKRDKSHGITFLSFPGHGITMSVFSWDLQTKRFLNYREGRGTDPCLEKDWSAHVHEGQIA